MLTMISKVREVETPEDLQAMQQQADGILRETLDCFDDGTIEEGDLSAIALVFEQFNHAIADRRLAIALAAPGVEPARMRAMS